MYAGCIDIDEQRDRLQLSVLERCCGDGGGGGDTLENDDLQLDAARLSTKYWLR